jgi:hypothetical protein
MKAIDANELKALLDGNEDVLLVNMYSSRFLGIAM